jgi:hypothetical protein
VTGRIYGVSITWTDGDEIGVEQWQLPPGGEEGIRVFLTARLGRPHLEQLMPIGVRDALIADGRVLEIFHDE